MNECNFLFYFTCWMGNIEYNWGDCFLGYFINWLCKYSGVNFDRMIGWIFNEILGNLLVDFPSIFSWIFPQWNTWIKSNIYRQFSADFVVSLMAFKTGLWITKNDSLLGNPNVFIGVFEKWSLKSPRKFLFRKSPISENLLNWRIFRSHSRCHQEKNYR